MCGVRPADECERGFMICFGAETHMGLIGIYGSCLDHGDCAATPGIMGI